MDETGNGEGGGEPARAAGGASPLPAPADQARVLANLLGNLDGMAYRCRVDADWTMEFVSEGCLRLTGYAPRDLLLNSRISYEEVTHPEDRGRVRQVIHEAIADGRRFDVEYRVVRADGTVRWVWERGTVVQASEGRPAAIEGFIQDITDRHEAERRYRDIFENAVEGIFQTTLEGRYLRVNPALARIYGYDSPQELIERVHDIRHQLYLDPERRSAFMARMREEGRVTGFESQVRRKDGSVIWISESARLVTDGAEAFYEGTVEDISERKRYQAEIEHQATHDALTGLPNRSLLRDRLSQALLYAQRDGGRVAVAFLDLDLFKVINDSLGHHAGDALLVATAQRLRRSVRDSDTVARQGGDEFVLVFAEPASTEAVSQMAQRVLDVVREPWSFEGRRLPVSCSMGISLYPQDGADADTLLRCADSAMYQAKEAGRNNFQYYTAELNAQAAERLEMQTRLRQALELEQFLLHYQPRLALASRRIVGAEALIRWRVPGQGLISPARFIPMAEETGLVVPIGEWVLATACRQARQWLDEGLAAVPVAVNVSARQFRQGDLVTTVQRVLEESCLPPQLLELELTESVAMHDADALVATLDALRRLGVSLAVDDFGTGYSSLGYLKRFPVDRLKIDRSFVRDLATDRDDAAITQAVISLGHALGLKVVAEGVETAEQSSFLLRHGCDEVQGFYYGMPVPAAEFRALLSAAG